MNSNEKLICEKRTFCLIAAQTTTIRLLRHFSLCFFETEKKCENFKGKTAYCDAVGYYFVVPHTPEGGGIAHLADIQSGTRSTDVNAANAHKKVVKFGKTKY